MKITLAEKELKLRKNDISINNSIMIYETISSDVEMFVDGSCIESTGVSEKKYSVIKPNKELEISLEKNESGEIEIKILDNRYSNELIKDGSFNFSNRTTTLNKDGTSFLQMKDEQGFSECEYLNKKETAELFGSIFGLDLNGIQNSFKQEEKNILNEFFKIFKIGEKESKKNKFKKIDSKRDKFRI